MLDTFGDVQTFGVLYIVKNEDVYICALSYSDHLEQVKVHKLS